MFDDLFRYCSEPHIAFLGTTEMQKLHIVKIRAVWKLNFQCKIWDFLFFYLKVLNQNERPDADDFQVAKFPYPVFFPHLSSAKENRK